MVNKYTGLNQDYFVSFELAERLKDIGFDYPTIYYWETAAKIAPEIHHDVLRSNTFNIKELDLYTPEDWNGNQRYEIRGIISAPTYWDVIEWLKNRAIYLSYIPTIPMDLIGTDCYYYFWKWVIAIRGEVRTSKVEYNSHYEALEKGIDYIVRLKIAEIPRHD